MNRILRGAPLTVGAVGLALLLPLVFTGAADAKVAGFPYRRPLEPGPIPEGRVDGALGIVPLNVEIYGRIATDFSDLRIADGDGNEVPRLVRTRTRKRTHESTHTFDANILEFRELEGNRAEVIVATRPDTVSHPHVITLSTPLKNFEKQVTVYGSRDRVTWSMLAANVPVFDYSRFIDLRSTAISFDATDATSFKLEVAGITESHQSPLTQIVRETRGGEIASEIEKASFDRSDFRIDRVSLGEIRQTVLSDETVLREYPVSVGAQVQHAEDKTTTVELVAGCVPLTEVSIVTDRVNFSRAVRLEVPSEDGRAWSRVAATRVHRIRLGGYSDEALTVQLGRECRASRYRLVIEDQDNPPLDISGVVAKGPVYDVVFFRQADERYTARYGSGAVPPPRYDIADVLTRSKDADAVPYTLGDESEDPAYSARGPRMDGRKLLVICVLAMVAVLAWVVGAASRKVERVAPE